MFYIKQHGLERSGTNYIYRVVGMNFKDVKMLANIGGWKHGSPIDPPDWDGKNWYDSWLNPKMVKVDKPEITDDELQDIKLAYDENKFGYLLSVKNPYSWLISLNRYRNNKLRNKKIKMRDESCNQIIKDLVKWNEIYNKYILFSKEKNNVCVVRYEEFIDFFEWIMLYIQKVFGLKRQNEKFQNLEKVAVNMGDTYSIRLEKNKFDPTRVSLKHAQENLNRIQLRLINQIVDEKVMKHFGYDYVN